MNPESDSLARQTAYAIGFSDAVDLLNQLEEMFVPAEPDSNDGAGQ